MSPTDPVPPDRVPPDNAPPERVSTDGVSPTNNAAADTVPGNSPLLRLVDVHSYYGESHVLQGVTFDVAAAEVVCLLGRNGVGKTTTLRSIIGITPPRRGHIRFAGHEVAAHPPHRIARLGIGFVPEDRRIFPELSVEDNLEVVRRHPGGRWPLERIYETMPLLADIRHRRGDVLSGGQQQMLAIARALAIDPTLLLLDEPNEGLAPIIVEEIGRLVDALAGDTTILFTEHKLHFSMLHAQRALVMEKGRIVWQGTTVELAERTDIQDRYLGL